MTAVVVNNNYQKLNDLTSDQDDDDTPDIEDSEKQSPETSIPNRPCSEFSILTSSAPSRKGLTRSYRLAQLEQALQAARILKTNDDRIQFENDCLIAIKEKSFGKFTRDYYKKIHDHNEEIKRQEETKKFRRFAFVDFEKNYMALYPAARDIKIIFVDESKSTTLTKTTNSRSASAHPKSAVLAACDKDAVELFYADCSRRFLHNNIRAKKEVEKFAHQAARSFAERFPAVTRPPQRVQVIDKRESIGQPNEHVLREMNHRRSMSLIANRRQLVVKMMTQTKKNQFKMEHNWKRRSIGVDNPTCYREILERANEFEEEYRDKSISRPQTAAVVSKRTPMKCFSLIPSNDVPAESRVNTAPPLSSCVTSFQDSLSLFSIENTKNVRVLLPTRPLTAPTKTEWINYC
ncbi:hypothetical protein I4U23_019819 [Adineta vaga]|nr:hypothetical protein I4U23_019819 [Adineta vaga]